MKKKKFEIRHFTRYSYIKWLANQNDKNLWKLLNRSNISTVIALVRMDIDIKAFSTLRKEVILSTSQRVKIKKILLGIAKTKFAWG